MPEPQTFPCFSCEGTGITHEGYAGHLCPDCDGLGVYEQPIENIEGVFLTRHRAGCRYYDEGLNPSNNRGLSEFMMVAEGLNPHRHLSGCQCDSCRDCVRVEDELGEYSSEEALGNVGLY